MSDNSATRIEVSDAEDEPRLLTDGGQSDAKVVGHNKLASGETVGVWGEVDSADGCGLATPNDARIDGIIDTNETDFVVTAGTTNTGNAKSVVLGHASNSAATARAATIAGGGSDDGSVSTPNEVTADYGTVGGGLGNTAGGTSATVGGGSGNTASGNVTTVGGGSNHTASATHATVAGGDWNTASGEDATVGGGSHNTASAAHATVAGGNNNTADGNYSLAAGRKAKVRAKGSFVWGDASSTPIESTLQNEVVFQAGGGVAMFTSSDLSTGARLKSGSGSWASASSRTVKSNVETVDPGEALAGVRDLDVATWNYDDQDESIRHMGPMAEEFHDEFGLGEDPERITNVDADGVAFAAIQGLAERLEDRDDRIEAVEAENERLRERLAAVEESLGIGDAAEPAPADD